MTQQYQQLVADDYINLEWLARPIYEYTWLNEGKVHRQKFCVGLSLLKQMGTSDEKLTKTNNV